MADSPSPLSTLEAQLPAALQAAISQPDVTHKLVAVLAILCLPFVNALLAKFGLPPASDAQMMGAMFAIVGVVGSHVVDSIHARSVAAAQANAATPAAAVADLNKGPTS